MIRIVLTVLLVAGALLWWKREEAGRLVAERIPAAAPYLTATAAPGKGADAPAGRSRTPPAVPVILANAEKKSLPVTIEAVGTVQSLASIQIKARVDSQIATVDVEEGAKVEAGDLLLTLDNRSIKAQLAQAQAMVAKNRAQLLQARRDFARAEDLLAKRISTEVQRDTAATTVKVQEAQLAADEAQGANLAALLSYTRSAPRSPGGSGRLP
jgi:multidrug efflux system membrane fusion protein